MPAILIVDDNPIQAVTRRLILERAHIPSTVSSNGAAALARVEAGEHIGFLITDHCMPEMSGPELVSRLRQLTATLPILVLSGLAEAEAEYEGMDVIFRLKPIPPEELIAIAKSQIYPQLDQTA